jgi:hypothetical protein
MALDLGGIPYKEYYVIDNMDYIKWTKKIGIPK